MYVGLLTAAASHRSHGSSQSACVLTRLCIGGFMSGEPRSSQGLVPDA